MYGDIFTIKTFKKLIETFKNVRDNIFKKVKKNVYA